MTAEIPIPAFTPAPLQPALRAGEVHLWSGRLEEAPPDSALLLSAAEWARAGRFQFERDRENYVASRAIVRSILSAYAGDAARDLRFAVGPHGKPALEDSMLRFNLSHSGQLLFFAVTYGRELGVDLEEIRGGVSFEMLADHYFTAQDAWQLRLLPPPERARHFYRVWTRTEAQLKAAGIGLTRGTEIADAARWSVASFAPVDGYAGALAVEGGHFQLQCFTWQNPARLTANADSRPGNYASARPLCLESDHSNLAAG